MVKDQNDESLDQDFADDFESEENSDWFFDLPEGAWQRQEEKNLSLRRRLLDQTGKSNREPSIPPTDARDETEQGTTQATNELVPAQGGRWRFGTKRAEIPAEPVPDVNETVAGPAAGDDFVPPPYFESQDGLQTDFAFDEPLSEITSLDEYRTTLEDEEESVSEEETGLSAVAPTSRWDDALALSEGPGSNIDRMREWVEGAKESDTEPDPTPIAAAASWGADSNGPVAPFAQDTPTDEANDADGEPDEEWVVDLLEVDEEVPEPFVEKRGLLSKLFGSEKNEVFDEEETLERAEAAPDWEPQVSDDRSDTMPDENDAASEKDPWADFLGETDGNLTVPTPAPEQTETPSEPSVVTDSTQENSEEPSTSDAFHSHPVDEGQGNENPSAFDEAPIVADAAGKPPVASWTIVDTDELQADSFSSRPPVDEDQENDDPSVFAALFDVSEPSSAPTVAFEDSPETPEPADVMTPAASWTDEDAEELPADNLFDFRALVEDEEDESSSIIADALADLPESPSELTEMVQETSPVAEVADDAAPATSWTDEDAEELPTDDLFDFQALVEGEENEGPPTFAASLPSGVDDEPSTTEAVSEVSDWLIEAESADDVFATDASNDAPESEAAWDNVFPTEGAAESSTADEQGSEDDQPTQEDSGVRDPWDVIAALGDDLEKAGEESEPGVILGRTGVVNRRAGTGNLTEGASRTGEPVNEDQNDEVDDEEPQEDSGWQLAGPPKADASDDDDILLRAFNAHAAAAIDDQDEDLERELEKRTPVRFDAILDSDSEQLVHQPMDASTEDGRPTGLPAWAPQRAIDVEDEEYGADYEDEDPSSYNQDDPHQDGGADSPEPPWAGDGEEHSGGGSQSGNARTKTLVRELVETGLLALLVFLAVRASFQNFKVEGESMYPTLENGQYIIVNKLAYSEVDMDKLSGYVPFISAEEGEEQYVFTGPERGTIIVLHSPRDTSEDLIKRIIGLPGDTFQIVDGQVYINGFRLEEPYVNGEWTGDYPSTFGGPILIGPDEYFVMGDNRRNSQDSRSPQVGLIHKDLIVGKAMVSYWPKSQMGLAPNGRAVITDEPVPQLSAKSAP